MATSDDSIRILHVDDDPDFGEITARFLEREDARFDVEFVTTASEGLDRLATAYFDCIVSDYEMPGQSGIELLEDVRADFPTLPFILFTGKGSEEIASDAISAGVTDYLQKEGGTDQYAVLANRIGNAVDKYRVEREAERTRSRLEAITANSNDAILTIDSDSTIRFANVAVERLFGYTPDELIGESLTTIMPSRYHDDHLDAFDRYLETGERTIDWNAIEFVAEHRDGHEVPVSVSFSEFEEDGHRQLVGILRDISDRVRMEEELRERERQFRQMAENIQEVVWMSDPEKEEIFYVNPAYEEIWGHSVEELYDDATGFLDLIHPEDRSRVKDALDTQVTGNYDEEYRIVRPDGEVRWIRDRAVPVENDAGEVYRIVGIASDITEQRAHNQELERTRELLNNTEQIADVGGWEIDTETQDVFWSEHLFEMLGVDYDEEPPLEEALDVYVEEDRPRVENAVEEALTTGEPFDVEARFERPDGEIRWFQIQGEPTVENGEVVTLRGAVQDITDQRRREDVLREMYEIISNRHRSFEEQVKALLELGRAELDTQYGTLSEIRGEDYVFEFVAADDDSIQDGDIVPVAATNCELVASTEETVVLGDVARDAPEETDRAGFTDWGISCYIGAPVFVEEGVYGTFCFYDTEARADQFSQWERTLVDLMSRWVSYELQRQQANDQLQAQNDQLEQFASVVSHDLRNPLKVAEGNLHLAQEECESEYLDKVATSHDRMHELIEDLLTLAREGEHVGDGDDVDLDALIEQCWQTVGTAEATLRTETDLQLRADRSRLQQLLENLIRNAIEHGGEDITLTIGDLPNGFFVEDDGPGIPEEQWDTVFDAGYSTTETGTGFGLSIVKQIAEAHGWSVRVTRGDDGGARFEITGVATGHSENQ